MAQNFGNYYRTYYIFSDFINLFLKVFFSFLASGMDKGGVDKDANFPKDVLLTKVRTRLPFEDQSKIQ